MTVLSRVSDSQLRANLIGSSANAARDNSVLQAKISNGQAYLSFGDLSDKSASYLRNTGDLGKIQTYIANAKAIERKLTAQSAQIAAISDIAASARALFVRALGLESAGMDANQVNVQSRAMLDQVVSGLNTTCEGRYLFAGSSDETPPVAFGTMTRLSLTGVVGADGTLALKVGREPGVAVSIDVTPGATQADIAASLQAALQDALVRGETGIDHVSVTPAGDVCIYPTDVNTPPIVLFDDQSTVAEPTIEDVEVRKLPPNPALTDQNFYRGNFGATGPQVVVGDGLTLDGLVTALEPGFGKLIKALRIAETVKTIPDLDRDAINEALSLASDAIAEIAQTAAAAGSRHKTIEDLRAELETAEPYHQDVVDQIMNLDMGEAMTKLSAQQLQLQACYMVLARLSSLSLLNYVK